MKKHSAIALLLLLALFFTACGTAEIQNVTQAPTEASTVAPTELPTEAPTEAATEAPTETPTEAPTEAPTESAAQTSTGGGNVYVPPASKLYYITVNCVSNTVTVYKKDAEGNHTVPYKAMICSVGIGGRTPAGTYKPTGWKADWLALVGGVYGRYCTQIRGNYLFHSVPYTKLWDNSSLQPGEFDKLGSAASHGCIRLQMKDAKWIYDNVRNIEKVYIHYGAEGDPLGRPSAPKIGSSAYAGWDPSDTNPNNPWHSAVPDVPEESTDEPTEEPTTEPAVESTVEPTTEPSVEPTIDPSIEPTDAKPDAENDTPAA
jgi:lipoprotein-anchoring transpeptidase ErfK/SrfK